METNLTNTTPVDETVSTTPATEPTREPVTTQAPAAQIVTTPTDTETPVTEPPAKKPYVVEETWPGLECSALKEPDDPAEFPASAADPEPDPAAPTAPGLPDGYLANGYYAVSEKGHKYLRSEFVGDHAEFIARNLAPMKATDFNKLLKELKRAKKTTLPYEARETAMLELVPKSIALVGRKRAPSLLTTFIRANVNHVQCDEDFSALYRHFESVGAFLVAMEGGE